MTQKDIIHTKPVTPPSELYGTLLQHNTRQVLSKDSIHSKLDLLRLKNRRVWLIAVSLLRSGCRLSEIMPLNSLDYCENDNFIVHGRKGSSDRLVTLPELAFELRRARDIDYRPFACISRYTVLRQLKAVGIYYKDESMNKARISHLFRFRFLEMVNKHDLKADSIRKIIGHKSVKSTNHYLTKINKHG